MGQAPSLMTESNFPSGQGEKPFDFDPRTIDSPGDDIPTPHYAAAKYKCDKNCYLPKKGTDLYDNNGQVSTLVATPFGERKHAKYFVVTMPWRKPEQGAPASSGGVATDTPLLPMGYHAGGKLSPAFTFYEAWPLEALTAVTVCNDRLELEEGCFGRPDPLGSFCKTTFTITGRDKPLVMYFGGHVSDSVARIQQELDEIVCDARKHEPLKNAAGKLIKMSQRTKSKYECPSCHGKGQAEYTSNNWHGKRTKECHPCGGVGSRWTWDDNNEYCAAPKDSSAAGAAKGGAAKRNKVREPVQDEDEDDEDALL